MLLFSLLEKQRDFSPMLTALKKEKKPVLATGISSALRALFPAALIRASGEKAVLILPDETEAASLAKALAEVFPATLFFPARDFSLVRVDGASRDFSVQRLRVLSALATGDFDCVVTTVEAACQATMPPEVMHRVSKKLRIGQRIEKEELLHLVAEAGYERAERVEGAGQYASRGDLVDVFPAGGAEPIRIELFGDEIDAMGYFDPVTQRRRENVREFTLTPAEEILFSAEDRKTVAAYLTEAHDASRPEEKEKRVFIRQIRERMENGLDFPRDLFLPLVYRFSTLLDYLSEEWFFFFDPAAARDALSRPASMLEEELKGLWEDQKTLLPPREIRLLEEFEAFCARLEHRRGVLIENFFGGHAPVPPSGIFTFRTRSATVPFREMTSLGEELDRLEADGYRVAVLCENSLAAQNLLGFLEDTGRRASLFDGTETELCAEGIAVLSRAMPSAALCRAGFELSDTRVALLTDAPQEKKRPSRRKMPVKADARQKLMRYTDLAVGDYVVHASHGIGRFLGVEKMKSADGSQKDFIKLAYAGSDLLYVPCSNLDSVSKYIGPKSDSDSLKLHKLGGAEWRKATSRAKAGAKDIAKKLIALYAARQRQKGYAFSPDTTWQNEFEEAFPYGETEGQLRATREIKEDMEKPIPMDRLLCGDVGFGKTEVALRGVFKCVMDNKQAAILVPTTILAWQHYQTLLARFKGYPVRIEMLSRFRDKKEQKKILEKLREGQIDVLVGTHRLLQTDVVFSDLGFLVIDEEQRFGVTHKERLKEMSAGVDVLTLTATPIPRTMNMALGGIKDMSLLEEAPEDRFPVQTYVLEYDRCLVEEAIRRELRRNGQVFYLNNNIEALEATLPALQRAFPEASFAIAHGKMDRDTLSDLWKEMMDHKIDVLLCTTIIETGIDLPDANTLIIENADHFGLSQLHQIRGRVGRSDRKAYAYLTYRKGKMLSEDSVKRLEAIREYTRFGSGFQIALRDLEIRGAGNLLGAEQSGHLDSVGYDMYMKILSDAVLEEKGLSPKRERVECVIDLALDGFIPETYVPYPAERMDLYRKIASVRTQEDEDELLDELLDRFGTVPRSVENLFAVARLRAACEDCAIKKISQRGNQLLFDFARAAESSLLLLAAVYASRLTLSLVGEARVTLTVSRKGASLSDASELVDHYRHFLEENPS